MRLSCHSQQGARDDSNREATAGGKSGYEERMVMDGNADGLAFQRLSTNACVVSALREREQRLISRRMAVPLSYASAYMLGFACASPHGQIISIEPKPQPVLAHTRRRDGILLVFIVLQHLAQMADA